MATPNLELIAALRKTAKKLEEGAPYQWGHMGSCNCGNLAQEISKLTKAEIHEYAMRNRQGDWSEQTDAYCPVSNQPMDLLITQMTEIGLTTTDLKNLEKLSDREILVRLPAEFRYLQHNKRDHVVMYMREWANLLEEQLLADISLPTFEVEQEVALQTV
ncbi:hypothetical protein [Thermoflexibacter ruber]|uniref:Uncharacterized protein n=1 Tax=Thermoflexibacter ruber TaxID=1003 RepID=A0A1I2I3A7_9BACT|nr:hypothetical protein [Thermoflexibacter ruber]SFF36103.1 hypothetical protein SAMN04488541_102826 [Thermoflexibacter ruber]